MEETRIPESWTIELGLLKSMFTREYWEPDVQDEMDFVKRVKAWTHFNGSEFDFKKHKFQNEEYINRYLQTKLLGIHEIEPLEAPFNLLCTMGGYVPPPPCDNPIEFSKELNRFLERGEKLQKQKIHVGVWLDWL